MNGLDEYVLEFMLSDTIRGSRTGSSSAKSKYFLESRHVVYHMKDLDE